MEGMALRRWTRVGVGEMEEGDGQEKAVRLGRAAPRKGDLNFPRDWPPEVQVELKGFGPRFAEWLQES